jgi:serine O-acetyltransferase
MLADPHSFSRAWADLKADVDRYRVNEGGPTLVNLYRCPGIVASIHYRFAHWASNGRSPMHVAALVPLLFLSRWVQVWSGIGIDRRAVIGPGLCIFHFGEVIVTPWAVMGSNLTLQQGVTVGVTNRSNRPGGPVIGDRVFIGAGAKVIGPVSVGSDVAVGANAVVTADLPDRAVAVGVPAKVISHDGSFDIVHYAGKEQDPPRIASLARAVESE